MSSSAAVRRLKREYAALRSSPTPGFLVSPSESNFLQCHFLLFGTVFHATPYEGGVFHGVITFPPAYPMKPPSVQVWTESGRFQVRTKICMNMTDFHPETWNPMWNVRSILVGLVSLWNTDELTTGGVEAPEKERIRWARASLGSCLVAPGLAAMFPQLEEMDEERRGGDGSWPPPRTGFNAFVEEKTDAPPGSAKKGGTSAARKTNGTDDGAASSLPPKMNAVAIAEDPSLLATSSTLSKTQKRNAKKRAKAKAKKKTAAEEAKEAVS
mmetsp:Transcript_36714/g.85777  ORF Transcript_36714/g.85777 Transcript_36714/m.85777 type:complete len:269 (-) Transcript_36714:296-1102(-)